MKQIILAIILLATTVLNAQNIDKSYKDYDFQAGETTIFEDKFIYASNEKITNHWEFLDGGGAASIREMGGEKILSFDAFYTRLKPKIFGNKSLPDDFTVEYDAWLDQAYDSNVGVHLVFELPDGTRLPIIEPSRDVLRVVLPNNETISKDNPSDYFSSNFFNRWVHFSIAVYKNKMKVYIDHYKIVEVSNILVKPKYVIVCGDKMGEANNGETPIYIKNFRLATGFPINLFENGKFVTRNIKFDVNKAILKPESIFVIKQIKDYLDKNPTVKLEIQGHTDSDGTNEANLKLSQQRAEAVRSQLVSMGIAAEKLTTKGYGSSQPIDKNTTLEAKANNRRVEFIILK